MKDKGKIIIAPYLFIAVGLFAIYQGFFVLDFLTDRSGGTGLFPAIVGIIIVLSSTVWLIQEIKKTKDASASNEADAPVEQTGEKKGKSALFNKLLEDKWLFLSLFVGLLVVFLAKRLGMHFILGVFMLIFFRFVSKYSWIKSIIITLVASVIFYLIFSVWLAVFYPKFFGLF